GGAHPLLADSLPSGPGAAESLTLQELQPLVNQAIAAWKATGLSAQSLSVLDHLRLHVADLPGAELALALRNNVCSYGNDAGWGCDRMDVGTVANHELGHLLGFEHSATGLMEPTLMPVVRWAPEPLVSTGSVAAATTVPSNTGASLEVASSAGVARLT